MKKVFIAVATTAVCLLLCLFVTDVKADEPKPGEDFILLPYQTMGYCTNWKLEYMCTAEVTSIRCTDPCKY